MNQRLKRAIRTFSDAGIPRDVNAWTEADWRDLHEAMQAAVKKIAARHAARRCLKCGWPFEMGGGPGCTPKLCCFTGPTS